MNAGYDELGVLETVRRSATRYGTAANAVETDRESARRYARRDGMMNPSGKTDWRQS
jgi:hypothetical protein